MGKPYGELFRELREDRGLTLNKVTGDGDICSLQQLARFEKGESDLTISKFFSLLENIGLTLEEFEYASRGYRLDSSAQLLGEGLQLYNTNNNSGLQTLIAEQEEKGLKSKKQGLIIIMLKNMLSIIDSEVKVADEDKLKIAEHLFDISEWGHFELLLYNNTMRLLSTADIDSLSSDIMKRSFYYKEIPRNKELVMGILLNSLISMLNRGEITKARRFEVLMRQQKMEEDDLGDRIVHLFATGALNFHQGKTVDGKEKMQQAIDILKILGSYHMAKSYQDDYDEITVNEQKKCDRD